MAAPTSRDPGCTRLHTMLCNSLLLLKRLCKTGKVAWLPILSDSSGRLYLLSSGHPVNSAAKTGNGPPEIVDGRQRHTRTSGVGSAIMQFRANAVSTSAGLCVRHSSRRRRSDRVADRVHRQVGNPPGFSFIGHRLRDAREGCKHDFESKEKPIDYRAPQQGQKTSSLQRGGEHGPAWPACPCRCLDGLRLSTLFYGRKQGEMSRLLLGDLSVA